MKDPENALTRQFPYAIYFVIDEDRASRMSSRARARTRTRKVISFGRAHPGPPATSGPTPGRACWLRVSRSRLSWESAPLANC